MFKFFTKFIKNSSLSLMSLIFTGLIVFGGVYFYMTITLPDVNQLKEMSKQIPLRVYSSDGKLIGEFGEKKRIPVTLEQVPKQLINAILDTEDQRFYEHKGVDFLGIVRAAKKFLVSGKKSEGASTITMQVAKNFFLSPKKTFWRKINEILLAFKIDRTFSKQEILELYLNKIYCGNRAYGVAAAAQVYYGKPLDKLNLPQLATIAGMPQAPSRDNPIANPGSAQDRRNHVLQRMLENDHISLSEYTTAISAPIATSYHELLKEVNAPYVAEMVRNAIVSQFGEAAYNSGLKVYTTIDSNLQNIANQSLHDGILAYDRRHGYRGPEKHFAGGSKSQWQQKLRNIMTISDLQPAVVVSTTNDVITALLGNGRVVDIHGSGFSWANSHLVGGDVIRVYKNLGSEWQLAQLPQIEGALVSLNPNNGAILSLVGGFSYADSNFNRVTQAQRQPGSGFKPFIYSAALEKGFTLASVINDAPVVMVDQYTKQEWRPQNDSKTFHGPTRLRDALVRSINLVSIRLLQSIGVSYAVEYIKKFGFEGLEVPALPSLALGVGQITPLKMVTGYAVFANGGYKVDPFLINSIIDADDKEIFHAKSTVVFENQNSQSFQAPRVITPQNAYIITDALKDVIRFGTARRALSINRGDLAGKTGTTNDYSDAWFCGYNSDLVAVVWLGFDKPESTHEHGNKAALPIWVQFMQNALANKPERSMRQPSGITTVRIDKATGLLANPSQENTMFEIFTTDTVPSAQSLEQHPEAPGNDNNNNGYDMVIGPLF